MKFGIIFETQKEIEDKLHPELISNVWSGVNTDSLYDSNLHLHRKFYLKEQGVDEQTFDTCKHLIKNAKSWTYKGVPNGICVSVDEYGKWEILLNITKMLLESDHRHLETLTRYIKK